MDHESTLANAGSAKKGQTFDQQGTNDFTVFKASLASGTDDYSITNAKHVEKVCKKRGIRSKNIMTIYNAVEILKECELRKKDFRCLNQQLI